MLISREDFAKWIKAHKWLQIEDKLIPQGHQIMYLTPAGNFIIEMRDIKGNLIGIGPLVIIPQTAPQIHGLDLRSGKQFPG